MAINYGLNKGIDAALPKGQGAWSEAGRGVASTLSGAVSGYAAAGPIGAVTGAVMNPAADLASSVGDIRESHANAAANRAVPQAPVSKDFGGYRDAEAQATAAKMKATRGAAAFAPAAPSPAPLPKMDYLNKPNPFAQPAAAAPAAAAAPPAGMTMPGTPWKPIQDPASQFNGPAESSVDNGWVTTGRHDMARIQGKYGTPGSAVGTVSYNKPANPNQPAVKAAALLPAPPAIQFTSMTSTQPVFVDAFVKRCCDLGLSADATVILLDAAQQDEICNHPAYVEGWNKVAGMAKVLGTVGKGLDWMGNKVVKPMFKTPRRGGMTLGIPAVAGGGVLGARALNGWDPFTDSDIGKAFKNLPVGAPGASSGGAGGSGGGAYSTTNPFDYIQRASGGSSFGTGGGGSGAAGGHPGTGQLQTLKQQKLNIDTQKSQHMKDLSAAMADQTRFSEVPRMRRQLTQFDTQSNAVARQMSDLTSSLTAEQNKMHSDAQQGLRAIQSLAPKVQGKYDKYTNLADGGGNMLSRWWAGGDAKIRQRQQEAADMLQALNAREKTMHTARATNLVD